MKTHAMCWFVLLCLFICNNLNAAQKSKKPSAPQKESVELVEFKKQLAVFVQKNSSIQAKINAAIKASTLLSQLKVKREQDTASALLKKQKVSSKRLEAIVAAEEPYKKLVTALQQYPVSKNTATEITNLSTIIDLYQKLSTLHKKLADTQLQKIKLSIQQIQTRYNQLQKPTKPDTFTICHTLRW